MEKEKKQTIEKNILVTDSNDELQGDNKTIHPLILEEEAELAISFINKLIWSLFGILILVIIIGSVKSIL
jgi:hypothetical protein